MKTGYLLLTLGLLIPGYSPAAESASYQDLMDRVAELQEEGSLEKADELVKESMERMEDELTPEQKRALEYELVRSERIAQDYSLTEERLRELLKERYREVTDEEITQWIQEGKFDSKVIKGEMRFVGPSLSNLFFRNPELRERRKEERSTKWTDFLQKHSREVIEQTKPPHDGLAPPVEFEVSMSITVKPGVVPEGEVIRCWMPYPVQYEAQTGVELLSATPEVTWMNAADYPMRSLYFEQPSKGSEPTEFKATYTVTTYPRRYDLDPERVASVSQTDNDYYDFYTSEEPPHVVFSDRIRRLADEIVGEETNPVKKARRIYDWLAKTKHYSYAREYSTIRCIPEYVLDNEYGDCGQIALTFITLGRAAGVPARWQSGWIMYPDWENLHDWTEIYVAPYGWVPVDPDYGMEFQATHDYLAPEELEHLQDFYFGGLDAYRLVVNRRHGYPHYPPKKDFRSDNVDFQRGELETASGENIYFGDFSYRLEKKIISGGTAQKGSEEQESEQKPADPGAAR